MIEKGIEKGTKIQVLVKTQEVLPLKFHCTKTLFKRDLLDLSIPFYGLPILRCVYLSKLKPTLILVLYRPPNKTVFNECLNETFKSSTVLNVKLIYLVGDFNINLFNMVEGYAQAQLFVKHFLEF